MGETAGLAEQCEVEAGSDGVGEQGYVCAVWGRKNALKIVLALIVLAHNSLPKRRMEAESLHASGLWKVEDAEGVLNWTFSKRKWCSQKPRWQHRKKVMCDFGWNDCRRGLSCLSVGL